MDYQFPKKQYNISNSTKDRVEACKRYIERKYSMFIKAETERRDDWSKLIQKMNDLNIKQQDQQNYRGLIMKQEAEQLRRKRAKVSINDFESIAIIGRGAFGEVRVCRVKKTGEIVAVKKMKKREMLAKNQIAHLRAERDILSQNNPWIVDMICSFQDDKHLYLVMEYMAGGDLMTLLMKKDILTEDEAKFYIAELVLAVDSIHKMNYIHRDLKPDNILIDRKGHLKLSDFGLCKYTEIKPKIDFGKAPVTQKPILSKLVRKRQLALSTVGTPDYIAPEVFTQQGYSEIVDWWSVGVMLYEMVVGYPPFFSDEPQATCQKILHWQQTFQIPNDITLSPQCTDLIRRLIAEPNERSGINGVQEIKIHPFFQGIDWKKLRDKQSPYTPKVCNEIDTQNFEKFEEEDPWGGPQSKRTKKANFQGYSYNKVAENQVSPVRKALEEIEYVQFPKPMSPIPAQRRQEVEHQPSNRNRKLIDPKQKQIAYAYNQGAKSNSPSNRVYHSPSPISARPSQGKDQTSTILNILSQFKKKRDDSANTINNSLNYSARLPNLSKRSIREGSPKNYYQM